MATTYVTNCGNTSFPCPQRDGTVREIAPGATERVDVDEKEPFIVGNVHARTIVLSSRRSDVPERAAEAGEGAAARVVA